MGQVSDAMTHRYVFRARGVPHFARFLPLLWVVAGWQVMLGRWPLWPSAMALVVLVVCLWMFRRSRVLVVDPSGITLGQRHYPIDEVTSVGTQRWLLDGGQRRRYLTVELVDRMTVRWQWIEYAPSLFGRLAGSDQLGVSTQRYLAELSSALADVGIEHDFPGLTPTPARVSPS